MKLPKVIAALMAVALFCGCGTVSGNAHYEIVSAQLRSGEHAAASDYIDAADTKLYRSKKNRLIYLFDKCMALHLAGQYENSNRFIEEAKGVAERLWTESVSEHAASWLGTDYALSYAGEDFELVMLHFIAAMNYIGLADNSAAQVEARQLTSKLELLNSRYNDDSKNHYTDDAFARWLSGKLGEGSGGTQELNDAWIDYKKALDVYQTDYQDRYGTGAPQILLEDAARSLAGLGEDFAPERAAFHEQFGHLSFITQAQRRALGEVVLIHSGGEAPEKVDDFWTSHIDDSGHILRIAFPRFVAKPRHIVGVSIKLIPRGNQLSASNPNDDLAATGQLFEDIEAIAIENLNDHMARIRAKAIARAVAKYVAARVAEAAGEQLAEDHGTAGVILQVAGILYGAASAAIEQADKRSWLTLPAYVNIARVFAPPGDYTAVVSFLDRHGSVVEQQNADAFLKAGKTTFISKRTF